MLVRFCNFNWKFKLKSFLDGTKLFDVLKAKTYNVLIIFLIVGFKMLPGLTKNAYHTILIKVKFFFIQFHTIPYVQKIV